jgi:hypothetical protein
MYRRSLFLKAGEGKPGQRSVDAAASRRALTACALATALLPALLLPVISTSVHAKNEKSSRAGSDLMLLDLPDLYQMAVEADATILATVNELTRFAVLDVEEVYGGVFRAPQARVMYQAQSWERRVDGHESLRFKPGERYLLFLRYHRKHDQVVAQDLFELMDPVWGRVKLEAEGGNLYIEAMRLLMGAATRPTVAQRQAVLMGILSNPNHLAAASAMGQAYRRRLGSAQNIPVLLAQMERGIAGLQFGALRILRRLAPTLPENLDRAALAEAIHRRVGWDGSAPLPVRQEAVDALLAIGPAAATMIRQVSRSDADQTIRYEAAVALLELES